MIEVLQGKITVLESENANLKVEVDNLRFYRLMRKIRKRVKYFLQKITRVAKGTQTSRMAANILHSEDMMWKFVRTPDLIETTNNLAERQARRYVIYRKNSFFTWSERGEKFIERMLSIFLTARLNNHNPVRKLQNLVAIPA